ncbi:hypothetical protein DLAC_01532 [Tieghemostelium lacteum]|uniref:Uncharacterized protein n=1 Tax=Tieghemostelium lacteum TaxID=361077 RepID=A0A152A5N7_TIELA|nr:hypothetical protein DLAC_01532 [Tieghemostelium lacteum]|eukprot:KYR01538.1 hypothetical protein DLAC_01532 [Tieghemostelium lacteum]
MTLLPNYLYVNILNIILNNNYKDLLSYIHQFVLKYKYLSKSFDREVFRKLCYRNDGICLDLDDERSMFFCRRLELSGIEFIGDIKYHIFGEANNDQNIPMINYVTSLDIKSVTQVFLERFPRLKNVNLVVNDEGVGSLDLNKLALEKGIQFDIRYSSDIIFKEIISSRMNKLIFGSSEVSEGLVGYLNQNSKLIDCENITIENPGFPICQFLLRCIPLKSLVISNYEFDGSFDSVIDTLINSTSSKSLENLYLAYDSGTLNAQSLGKILSDTNLPNLKSCYLYVQQITAKERQNNYRIQSKLHLKKLTIHNQIVEGKLNIFNYLSMVKVDKLVLSDSFFNRSTTLPSPSTLLDNLTTIKLPTNLEKSFPKITGQLVQIPSLSTLLISWYRHSNVVIQSIKSNTHLHTLVIDSVDVFNLLQLLQVINEIGSIRKLTIESVHYDIDNEPSLEDINTVVKLLSEAQWLKEFTLRNGSIESHGRNDLDCIIEILQKNNNMEWIEFNFLDDVTTDYCPSSDQLKSIENILSQNHNIKYIKTNSSNGDLESLLNKYSM